MFDSETEASSDPETEEGKRQDELIPLPETEGTKALECTLCDLKFEPEGGARAQLSSSELLAPEGQETQPGAVLHSKDTEGVEVVVHVESARIPVCVPVLEHRITAGPTHKGGTEAILGDREVGRQVGRQEGGMRTRECPSGRTGSMGPNGEAHRH